MFSKIVHFQVYERTIYALDAEGTMWRNDHPPTSDGWKPVPGPTKKQRDREDYEIQQRYQIDVKEKLNE